MRLTLRVLINILSVTDSQLENIANELRPHPEYHKQFLEAKRGLVLSIRAFRELNDALGDNNIN